MGDEQLPEPTCPTCGSGDVEPLQVVEHSQCGAVKPEELFREGDRTICPKCGRECDGELKYIHQGDLRICRDCGNRFDADKSVDVAGAETAVPTSDLWSGNDANLITFSSGGRSAFRTALSVVLLTLIVGSAVVTAVGTAPLLEEQSTSGHWEEYRSIVIFRNDDVQPYYETEAMRAVDRVFIEENASVTAGVIPAPGNLTLESDMEVCQYWRGLRNEHPKTFEYALHGYHHEPLTRFYEASEFGDVPIDRQRAMIQNGSRIMRDCLGSRPTAFIPPRETYDRNTSQVLAEEEFAVVSGGDWFTKGYYDKSNMFRSEGVLHVPSDGGFMKNWSTGEFYSQETLESRFDRAYENRSVYVQMIHYQYFTTQENLDTLRGLIEHMKSKEGVGFMTLGDFAEKRAEGRLEQTDDGWRVWVEEETEAVSVRTLLDRALEEVRKLAPGVTYRGAG